MNSNQIIHRQLINDASRITHSNALFGLQFPVNLEPTIYMMAATLSQDYQGGYWDFYSLSNDGFYMSPHSDQPFNVTSMNGNSGVMTGDALGVTSCLFAFSQLSFGGNALAETCAEHYHRLREYTMGLPEASLILSIID